MRSLAGKTGKRILRFEGRVLELDPDLWEGYSDEEIRKAYVLVDPDLDGVEWDGSRFVATGTGPGGAIVYDPRNGTWFIEPGSADGPL